jgi:hypothetical protein
MEQKNIPFSIQSCFDCMIININWNNQLFMVTVRKTDDRRDGTFSQSVEIISKQTNFVRKKHKRKTLLHTENNTTNWQTCLLFFAVDNCYCNFFGRTRLRIQILAYTLEFITNWTLSWPKSFFDWTLKGSVKIL